MWLCIHADPFCGVLQRLRKMPPKRPALSTLKVADSDKGATGGDLVPITDFHAAEGKFIAEDVTVDDKGAAPWVAALKLHFLAFSAVLAWMWPRLCAIFASIPLAWLLSPLQRVVPACGSPGMPACGLLLRLNCRVEYAQIRSLLRAPARFVRCFPHPLLFFLGRCPHHGHG